MQWNNVWAYKICFQVSELNHSIIIISRHRFEYSLFTYIGTNEITFIFKTFTSMQFIIYININV